MSFIVLVSLSPDPEETFAIGPFAKRWEAEDFIYNAHDDTEDPDIHLLTEDVDYASVVYLNPAPKENA